jgi:hypothetical protein
MSRRFSCPRWFLAVYKMQHVLGRLCCGNMEISPKSIYWLAWPDSCMIVTITIYYCWYVWSIFGICSWSDLAARLVNYQSVAYSFNVLAVPLLNRSKNGDSFIYPVASHFWNDNEYLIVYFWFTALSMDSAIRQYLWLVECWPLPWFESLDWLAVIWADKYQRGRSPTSFGSTAMLVLASPSNTSHILSEQYQNVNIPFSRQLNTLPASRSESMFDCRFHSWSMCRSLL